MRRVIIESPYAGNVPENVDYAKAAVRDCLNRGEAPIASHLLFTQDGILDDDQPDQRKKGIEAGLVWSVCADAVVVYVDRGVSKGMEKAIRYHEGVGTRVEYRSLKRSFA